jgi:hypothetical protein
MATYQPFIFIWKIVPVNAGDLFCTIAWSLLLALCWNGWQLAETSSEAKYNFRKKNLHTVQKIKFVICMMGHIRGIG